MLIFSSMHESGQREWLVCLTWITLTGWHVVELNQLTGIAAILTYPLDVEVVEAEEREAKEEEARRKAEENGEVEA